MNFLKLIGELKVYFTQAGNYIGMINFVLLLGATKQLYKVEISAYILAPFGFICMVILGWIDYKFILPKTITHVNKKNDIKSQLDRIEDVLKQRFK